MEKLTVMTGAFLDECERAVHEASQPARRPRGSQAVNRSLLPRLSEWAARHAEYWPQPAQRSLPYVRYRT